MPNHVNKHHAEQIGHFLRKLKTAISKDNLIILKRNLVAINKLGLTLKGAKHIINTLAITDCNSGPDPDDKGRPGDIWKFSKKLGEKIMYIKFRDPKENSDNIICLSFHETKHE